MPSSSKAQAILFARLAHDPVLRKKMGISEAKAREWHTADKRTKKYICKHPACKE